MFRDGTYWACVLPQPGNTAKSVNMVEDRKVESAPGCTDSSHLHTAGLLVNLLFRMKPARCGLLVRSTVAIWATGDKVVSLHPV